MYPNVQIRVKINARLEKFKKIEDMFAMSIVVAIRDKKQLGNSVKLFTSS